MKTFIHIITCLLIVGIFTSCGHMDTSRTSDINEIVIPADSELQEIAPADIDSIKLDTGEAGPIGMISKFVAYRDNCFILDPINKCVWKFGLDGHLSGVIQKIGNGPGEYTALSDIDIDKNGNLYLLDMRKSALLVYSTDSLKYVSEIKLPERAQAFCAIDSMTFYLHKASEDRKVIIDLALYRRGSDNIEPIFRYNDSKEYRARGSNNSDMWRSGDSVLFYHRFTKDIYLLEDTVKGYATLDTDHLPSVEQIQEYIEVGNKGPWSFEKSDVVSNVAYIYRNGRGLLSYIATSPSKSIYTDLTTDDSYNLQYDKRLIGVNLRAIGVWNNRFVTYREITGEDDPTLILYTIEK